jgi:type 1 glutamine amidotransferase
MRVIATLLVLAVGLFAQTPAPSAPKIQTLLVSGQNGHDWRTVNPLLKKALEDTGRFEVRTVEEFRGAGPETLAPYDLVVLNYSDWRKPGLRFGERADNALLDFVKSGKGLVLYHFSASAFDGWTGFEKLSGANWRPGAGQHSAPHDFTVQIVDPNHPITAGLPEKMVQTHDELYANLKWQPEGCCHVLATAWDDYSLYKNPQQPITGAGKAEPVLWTVDYGKGRVFADVLGHDGAAVQTPAFQATFARGAEWAATGKVTLH